MAFEYEVPTLDGMDEAMVANYIKVGDVYRLRHVQWDHHLDRTDTSAPGV